MTTSGLEVDRTMEALNRLDQTDALVEQILGDRAKLEQSSMRTHSPASLFFCSTNHLALRSPKESNQLTTRFTLRSRSLKANWIGTLSAWTTMFIPWLTRTGQLWYLFQESEPLDETEASSLSAWAQGYREVRKNCEILSHDAAVTDPSRRVLARGCVKHCLQRDNLDEIEMYALHSERKRKKTALSVSQEPNCGKRSRCYRCQHLGHMARECQNQASKDHPQAAAKSFSCQVTHLHSCTICLLTWRLQRRRKLWVGLQTRSKPRPIGTYPMTSGNHKLPVANRIFEFCRFGFGTRPWFDGHWSTAACGRSISCSMVV